MSRSVSGFQSSVVHPVDDAEKRVAPVPQHPLQAAAELRGLDLLAVAPADGVDGVGKDDAAFEQVDLVVELQAVDGKGDQSSPSRGNFFLGKRPW